jgi:hypothetical protein
MGLTRAESLLEPLPKQAPAHPFDDEGLELSAEDATELAKGSEKLHRLPEFRGWLPSREAIDELLLKVGESMEPGSTPDQEGLQKALQSEVLSATDRYFSPERREALIRSMRDSALSILQRDGEQNALEVVGTMQCIERCGLITDPPHEVGFLKAFFDKAIAVLLAQGQGSLRIPVRAAPADAGGAPSEGADAPAAEADGEDVAAPSES